MSLPPPSPPYGTTGDAAASLETRVAVAEAQLALLAVPTQAFVSIPATSTTSAVAVDMTDATFTATVRGRQLYVVVAFNSVAVTVPNFANFQLHLDGVNHANFVYDDLVTNHRSLSWTNPFTSVAAGSHTWKVMWYTLGGTLSHAGGFITLVEL